ncbi:hypothetical protein R5R35_000396 [Gryllus longicercus]|uniref:FAM69 N-terminal domain-containing protein n=1 Tax=Gryllus longicercus TaxID=2509291 RepID=A0AAN9VEG6_9ORTH
MFNFRRLPGILYHRRYTTLSSILLTVTILYYLLHWGIMCTNFETWQHIKRLCHLHQKGEAVGNLCQPLCIDKKIHSFTCHAFHAGKEAVFSANWEGTHLVFKASRRVWANNLDTVYWVDKEGRQHFPSEADFNNMIRDIVSSKLNYSISNDQLKRLSRLGFSKAKEGSPQRQVEMQNLWVLLQDNEYLCSLLYSDIDVFPQLLGTCGGFFAVEYLEPVHGGSNILSISDGNEEWPSRVKLAMLMMELLSELETNLPEPFHLCDIKMSHFGLVKGTQRLKFLDLDSAVPRTVASKATADGRHCTKHEECDFFDCRSLCNDKTKKCDLPVTNDNYQVVCEKIFLGWTLSGTVIIPGLLISPHTPSSLASLLRHCAHPNNSPRQFVPDDLKVKLYTKLTELDEILHF